MSRIITTLWLTGALLSSVDTSAFADEAPSEAAAAAHCAPTGPLAIARGGEDLILLPTGIVLVAGGSSRQTEIYDPAIGSWRLSGQPSRVYGARAVLLSSGKVMVVGPPSPTGIVLAADLYDPVTETWIPTGSPIARRYYGFTLTALPSGKVLLAGGSKGSLDTVAEAELYDPQTGTWKPTGSLATPRINATATLLTSGKVLVVGGWRGLMGFAEAELFDERTGRWSAAGSLKEGRYAHTTTLLPSGKVLVAGGLRGNAPTGANLGNATATEIYDPATGKWSATGALLSRYGHNAILLASGKVLVAGGGTPTTFDQGTELFDPATGSWSPSARLTRYRNGISAALLPSGGVLLVSGRSAEIYTPESGGSWEITNSLSIGRDQGTATLLSSGKVLVAGGESNGSVTSTANSTLASCELYDPVVGQWSLTGPLATARQGHTATLLPNGKVLVTGGHSGGPLGSPGPALASAELYDPATGSWRPTGSLTTARRGHTATLLPSGKVLVAGGRVDASLFSSAELYDPVTGQWSPTGSMSNDRNSHAAVLLRSGKVLVVGGSDAPSAEVYDPASETWSPTGFLSEPRIWATATLLPSGRVLLTGGSGNGYLAASEIYDPGLGTWTPTGSLAGPRGEHTAVLLPSGKVLVAGGYDGSGLPSSTELYDPATGSWDEGMPLHRPRVRTHLVLLLSGRVLVIGGDEGGTADVAVVEIGDPEGVASDRRPVITTAPATAAYGQKITIAGRRFRGDLPATSFPLVQWMSLENQQSSWLAADPRLNLWDDPMTVDISDLPSGIDPGWYRLTVIAGGRPSESKIVGFACSLAIAQQPENRTVPLGGTAIFRVRAQGARAYQWQKDGADILGATSSIYSTPPVSGADSGTFYRVRVDSECTSTVSRPAALVVEDHAPPLASILFPSGGEYWLLSDAENPGRSEVITWSMSDNVRVCKVEVALLYSKNGGKDWLEARGNGLPKTFGADGPCASPGATATNLSYAVPHDPPSGSPGSLYKIRILVTDQVGLSTKVESQSPFYIVRPNPDSVRTLILTNLSQMQERMGLSVKDTEALSGKLRELAAHPRVLGLVYDLNVVADLRELYAAWNNDPAGDEERANRLLFGCDATLAGCSTPKRGIHDVIRDLLQAYTGVKYLLLIGDDRVIPFARVLDETALLPESRYGDLPLDSTVRRALRNNVYLSDDPLGLRATVRVQDLLSPGTEKRTLLPELAVGRLVETPAEMAATIAAFIGRDGVLDLSELDSRRGHKVLVTGYDFLIDSARVITERWKSSLGVPAPFDDNALAPVDSHLVGSTWGLAGSNERKEALRDHLAGNGGEPYAIAFLNGHATHDQEGVPAGSTGIQGLDAVKIYGRDACVDPKLLPLDLAGGAVFAVGCHGGLPVPGSCSSPAERSLDLPQTFLARGAVVYVANTGFGWGLVSGIGYGERLLQILAEELTRGSTVNAGDAVRATKLRYFLEASRFDVYDQKSLLQWTLFGLPMYAIKTGALQRRSGPETLSGENGAAVERHGPVFVERRLESSPEASAGDGTAEVQEELPPYVTRLDLRFDLRAQGVYTKRSASGRLLSTDRPGCPAPPQGEPRGCYYTLNGLVERATGMADLPLQPYFLYDSRLSGTSQHGVLWKGATYTEETGWEPVFGELISNGGRGSDHGSIPKHYLPKARPPRPAPGQDDPELCPASDLEVNGLVVPAGESRKAKDSDTTYTVQRRYQKIELEVFYFNNALDARENCDQTGPSLGAPPYHRLSGTTLEWNVPAEDESGVWRVVVAYDIQGSGLWRPLELKEEPAGNWSGTLDLQPGQTLTYVLQAVDKRGNVAWLDFAPDVPPASKVPLDVPEAVEVVKGN